jgi:catechol 2,3-dioxygenase-like lactoylglutathione lyase family enzyme
MSINDRNLRSICHASLGTNNVARAKNFYTPLLKILGIEQVCDYNHAVAYGKGYPEIWLQQPFDNEPASVGNGTHIGFVASNKKQVVDFYTLAIKQGAICNGKPGARTDYGEPYYGCFVLDLDGNRIEASFWDEALAAIVYKSH